MRSGPPGVVLKTSLFFVQQRLFVSREPVTRLEFADDVLTDLTAFMDPIVDGGHEVNPAVQAADGGFLRGLPEGVEMAHGQAPLLLGRVGKCEGITIQTGEHFGGGCRDHTVAAGVFGERRGL